MELQKIVLLLWFILSYTLIQTGGMKAEVSAGVKGNFTILNSMIHGILVACVVTL